MLALTFQNVSVFGQVTKEERMTHRVTYDRREMERWVASARANNTFVRMNERQVRVTNRVAPQAAQFRPRVRFEVVTSD
jgi:hypothetical protein